MKLNFSKALVTGGAGFIGSNIVEELLSHKIETICIDNFIAGKFKNIDPFRKNKLFNLVEADISHYSLIKKHFKDVDVVFHEAASKCTVCMKDPYLDLDVNAKGTYNILEAAREYDVKKIVHASTGSVYGEGQIFPQDEKHPLNPISFYGVSKLAGEKYCNAFTNYYDMNITVLRYFHVYGPRQEYSTLGGVIPIFIRRILNGHSPIIFGDGSQIRSFTYVKDDVYANFKVAMNRRTKGNIYNCASGIKVSIKSLAETLLKILKREDLKIQYEHWRPGDIKIFDIDKTKIRKIGVEFNTSYEKGLLKTIEWMKKELQKN